MPAHYYYTYYADTLSLNHLVGCTKLLMVFKKSLTILERSKLAISAIITTAVTYTKRLEPLLHALSFHFIVLIDSD